MPWESRNGKGRYYTRSKQINGRVFREYLGIGPHAEAAAAEDAHRRAERQAESDARKAAEAQRRKAEAPLRKLDEFARLLLAASLTAAGYRQHDRGAWRRRRHARNQECERQ